MQSPIRGKNALPALHLSTATRVVAGCVGVFVLLALLVTALRASGVSGIRQPSDPYSAISSRAISPIAPRAQANGDYVFPLKRGANSRLLYDQSGKPFFWSGDTAWSLFVQLNRDDTVAYLKDRKAKNFNVVLASLIEHRFGNNAPKNIQGDPPFTGKPFSTPNEAYFVHADSVIVEAEALGIVLLLDPLYLGWDCGVDGWCADVREASMEDMSSWGAYVGSRYKGYSNIVWLIGGDTDPTSVESKITAFVESLLAQDSNHLVTMHNEDEALATDHWAPWLDVNNIYTYDPALYQMGLTAYNYQPTMPYFMLESAYENEHNTTPQWLRSQAYYSVLSGAVGYNFGNCPIWHFNAPAASAFCSAGSWQSNLNASGSVSMQYVAALFSSIDWTALAPDWNHAVVTDGYGTWGSTDYVTAASAPNLMVSYVPGVRTITVDMTGFAGLMSAQWYDPAGGTYVTVPGSPFQNTGTQRFTAPGNNSGGDPDWVLVLTVSAPVPAATSTPTITPTPPSIPEPTPTPETTPGPEPTLTPTASPGVDYPAEAYIPYAPRLVSQ